MKRSQLFFAQNSSLLLPGDAFEFLIYLIFARFRIFGMQHFVNSKTVEENSKMDPSLVNNSFE